MDEDGLPLMGSGIDLTKVPAIQQKRTVAFLNQFVVHTVQFLNRFSTVCEEVGPVQMTKTRFTVCVFIYRDLFSPNYYVNIP
uniref:WASH complex subunit 3 n=2 Tax=Sus scrofa TaxID=9823 RepID=A0A8D1XB69_PIG